MAEQQPNEAENVLKSRYMHVCVGLGVGAAFHPLQYTKILIQLGHEPLPLERGNAWIFFGRELYCLPNAFKYIRHIKKTEGFFGLYRGLGASICHNLLGLGVTMTVQQHLDEVFPDEELNDQELKAETDGQCYCRFFKKTLKESIAKTSGIIISRPLQVIMIRRMAQYIGGESIYVGIVGSFRTIYADEGLDGLFSGLLPQIVGDLTIFWASKTLLFAVDRIWRRYFNEENEESAERDEEGRQKPSTPAGFKQIIQWTIPYVVGTLCYPFNLVSTVMAVNGSPLKVGQIPYTPVFMHWQDCWEYLRADKQLKRGSKLIFRWYDGPLTYSDGQAYARTNSAW